MGNESAPAFEEGDQIGDLVVVRCVGRIGKVIKNSPWHYEMRCMFPLAEGPCGNLEVISQKYLVGKKHRCRCIACSGRRRAQRQMVKPLPGLDFAKLPAPSLVQGPDRF